MGLRRTNEELYWSLYADTNMAADQLEKIEAKENRVEALSVSEVTKLRNTLREAYCAAQELKTRLKRPAAVPKVKTS